MPARRLIGGYWYPLDVRAALDPARSRPYVEACIRRALREPASARNAARRRSLAAIERAVARSLEFPPTDASRTARAILQSGVRSRARAP